MRDQWTAVLEPLLGAARPRRITVSPGLSVPAVARWASARSAEVVVGRPLSARAELAIGTAEDWSGLRSALTSPIGPVVLLQDPEGAVRAALADRSDALWSSFPLDRADAVVLVPADLLDERPGLEDWLGAYDEPGADDDPAQRPTPSIVAPTPEPALDATAAPAPTPARDPATGSTPEPAAAPDEALAPEPAAALDAVLAPDPWPAARAAIARAEAEIDEIRADLGAELEAARAAHDATAQELADLRVALIEKQTEIELAAAEHSRLTATLDAARMDADDLRERLTALREGVHEPGAALPRSPADGRSTQALPAASGAAPAPPAHAAPPAGDAATGVAPPTVLPAPAVPWPTLHPSELTVQQAFAGTYGGTGDDADAVDAVSLPSPIDRRGVLVRRHLPDAGPGVDVVVCVHDALDDVRACLWSLVHKTTRPFRLILVDDGSDAETAAFLRWFATRHPAVVLVTNPTPPHGYTIAVNLGLRETTGAYVILLNSDTIVTFGWLDRIVERGESDPGAGILGPLSNAASHQSVPDLRDEAGWATNPLPDWLTPDGLALALRLDGIRVDARLPFINGFCFVVKRAVIDAVGAFDEEHFASGYCEENDYAQRARDAGFATAVVDDAYVFHAKSKSFGVDGRRTLAKRNYEIFLEKHGRERIQELVRGMERDPSLAPVRDAVRRTVGGPDAFATTIAGAGVPPLSIVFVLPGISDGGSGGSHSVYQETRGLRALGVPARIAIGAKGMDRARKVYDDADEVFEPFRDAADLAARTRDADVISATHNASVELLAAVRRVRRDFLPAYYVQDYEPLFTQADPAQVEQAIASYTAIDDMLLFAKTHWLCNVVGERHGVYVAKVEPSIDTDVYFTRDEPHDPDVLRVTAMLRPRTPRRQPFSTLHLLERLLDEFPGRVEVETFGCTDDALAKVARSGAIPLRHRGILPRTEVADLLRRTDVFLDVSMYQAFGRTAAEAMACGATAVVPRLGGAWEFAQQDHNAVLVDTFDRQASYEALAALVDDRPRVERLRAAARATAERFSVTRAALSEYAVFEHAHRERFGPR